MRRHLSSSLSTIWVKYFAATSRLTLAVTLGLPSRSEPIQLNCKGKVIITGVGKSGHIGAKIAATLSSTGTPSFFLNPLDAYHGDLGAIGTNDIVIAISNSGQTDELLRFIPMLIHNEIPIIE